MEDKFPFLSIVIANYNYGRFLAEAIESLISQSCQDFEIIICDAASTDNSVDIIKKYAGGLPPGRERDDPSIVHLNLQPSPISFWISEKDKGQSNAFNKGFSHAHGRFLTWLNADDVMLPGTIEKLKVAVEKHPTCEWFVGGCFWLDPQMQIVNCGRGRPFSEFRYQSGFVNGCGPSTIFSKRLLDSAGGVDERFHLMMDTDLWLRFAKSGARYRPFCNYAWGLRLHPGAKMSDHNFTADGKLDLKAQEAKAEADNRHRAAVKREVDLMLTNFPVKKLTPIRRLLSVCWRQVLAARMDLFRYRGKNYREYFT